jgi:hypothetical protein
VALHLPSPEPPAAQRHHRHDYLRDWCLHANWMATLANGVYVFTDTHSPPFFPNGQDAVYTFLGVLFALSALFWHARWQGERGPNRPWANEIGSDYINILAGVCQMLGYSMMSVADNAGAAGSDAGYDRGIQASQWLNIIAFWLWFVQGFTYLAGWYWREQREAAHRVATGAPPRNWRGCTPLDVYFVAIIINCAAGVVYVIAGTANMALYEAGWEITRDAIPMGNVEDPPFDWITPAVWAGDWLYFISGLFFFAGWARDVKDDELGSFVLTEEEKRGPPFNVFDPFDARWWDIGRCGAARAQQAPPALPPAATDLEAAAAASLGVTPAREHTQAQPHAQVQPAEP